jgi:hypothetical protein
LVELQLLSRKLAYHTAPDDSLMWKARFLALYDYPDIEKSLEFSTAYKLRRLVLREGNFTGFSNGKDPRVEIQLQVIRDMILGTLSPFSIITRLGQPH